VAIEARLENGGFTVGYSYFSGSLHFELVQRVRVRGLTITPTGSDGLQVMLGLRHWSFAVDRFSRHRFAVLDGAYAAGKRIGDLDFGQWEVVVEKIEKDRIMLDPETGHVVAEGDFLWLCGAEPALTRAWHYMNDGRAKERPSTTKNPKSTK
jgi:hypothetical protein